MEAAVRFFCTQKWGNYLYRVVLTHRIWILLLANYVSSFFSSNFPFREVEIGVLPFGVSTRPLAWSMRSVYSVPNLEQQHHEIAIPESEVQPPSIMSYICEYIHAHHCRLHKAALIESYRGKGRGWLLLSPSLFINSQFCTGKCTRSLEAVKLCRKTAAPLECSAFVPGCLAAPDWNNYEMLITRFAVMRFDATLPTPIQRYMTTEREQSNRHAWTGYSNIRMGVHKWT